MSSIPTSTSTSRAAGGSPLRSRRGRAGLAGGAVLLAALPLLAACSAGSDPEVYKIIPDNGNAKAGNMWMSNVWVVFDKTTGNAEVIGQVANTNPSGTEQLTGVTVGGVAATLVQPPNQQLASGVSISGNSVTIPGLKSVQFGQPGQPELEIANADVTLGTNAPVTFTFANGQTGNIAALVQPNSGLYAQYDPNGPNTASPGATPTGGVVTGTATASPTGTVTGTPTGTVIPTGTRAAGTPTGTAKASGGSTPTGTASSTAGH